MNVQPVVIDPELAVAKLKEYRNIEIQNRRKEDVDFRRLYRAAASGKPILDVAAAFQQTGLSEKGHPRLALAQAGWDVVYWRHYYDAFSCIPPNYRTRKENLIKPPLVDWRHVRDLRTPVPHVPPALRPKDGIDKYYILFEVPDWTTYSHDPFLLRRVTGWLFMVCGEWELTPLEVSLLRSL